MTRETFIAIFLEHGLDLEWSEMKWDAIHADKRDALTEEDVREAAKGWQKYAEEGGRSVMGWASGSDIADSVWSIVKDHIPKEAQPRIAQRLIEIFQGYDCDTMQETALWDLCHERCPCWTKDRDDPVRNCEKCDGDGFISTVEQDDE